MSRPTHRLPLDGVVSTSSVKHPPIHILRTKYTTVCGKFIGLDWETARATTTTQVCRWCAAAALGEPTPDVRRANDVTRSGAD